MSAEGSLAAQILKGDVFSQIANVPSESVDLCVTSPPYWGLRDYGVAGQIGLEPTFQEYVSKIVAVFHEVRRTLKPTGQLYLNLGDTYSNSGEKDSTRWPGKEVAGIKRPAVKTALPPKCLIGVPERVMLAMVDDRWILRNKIVWWKPNHMPSSVEDRYTNAHETIYFFSKAQRYWFDLDAVREPSLTRENRPPGIVRTREWGYDTKLAEHPEAYLIEKPKDRRWEGLELYGRNDGYTPPPVGAGNPLGKNPGDVWEINTQPFPEAHFATFPEALVERPIKASCPPNGTVIDPFMGSGTTGLVALGLARRFVGIEINPEYVALAKERMSLYLGNERLEPKSQPTGSTS
jgi:DNA modification methylase